LGPEQLSYAFFASTSRSNCRPLEATEEQAQEEAATALTRALAPRYPEPMPELEHSIVPLDRIERQIHYIRGHKVMLDSDLAELYGVETKVLNRAVKRNRGRFPADFSFQLTTEEAVVLRFQIGTSSLRSQSVTSKPVRGGRRYLPYVFTEHGVVMLSSVLRSERAVQVNIAVTRAFVRLRQMLASNADLARKLVELEKKYDKQFRVVFEAIRQLMETPDEPENRERIGFQPPKPGK
jgi:hypothetical protein